jgi:maltoporin
MRFALALVFLLGSSVAIAQPESELNPDLELPDPRPQPQPDPQPEPEPERQPEPAPQPQAEPAPQPPARKRIYTGHEDPDAAPAAKVFLPHPDDGFLFGSYGRVLAGADLRGGKPEPVAVVAHGPRIVERSYLELDFQYRHRLQDNRTVRTVVTLAFDDTLFHDTGEFDARPALRNVFAEMEVTPRATVWAGARMYRGDDIYLFDYWPLDDQNTVGAGARYQLAGDHEHPWIVSAHVGWNRLRDEFQFQEIDVPDPEQGATTVTQLNRQRTIASATFEFPIEAARPIDYNLHAKVHAEVQMLPAGTRRRESDGTFEDLPADTGFTLGLELKNFWWGHRPYLANFANVFARYSKGLAAFDELAPPTSFGADLKTTRASELVIGASANAEIDAGSVMFGAVGRRFVDADRNTQDTDDGWEYAVNARPLVHVWKDLSAGADLSYQVRFPRGLNPTSQMASDPAVLQIAPMLVWSPMGPSAYARPQIRAVYRAARLNAGARDLYAPDDPRHDRTWVHFVGVQVEWWFNSASYR